MPAKARLLILRIASIATTVCVVILLILQLISLLRTPQHPTIVVIQQTIKLITNKLLTIEQPKNELPKIEPPTNELPLSTEKIEIRKRENMRADAQEYGFDKSKIHDKINHKLPKIEPPTNELPLSTEKIEISKLENMQADAQEYGFDKSKIDDEIGHKYTKTPWEASKSKEILSNKNAPIEIVKQILEKEEKQIEPLHEHAKNIELYVLRDAEPTATSGVDFAFVYNKSVNHEIVKKLKILHQKDFAKTLSATYSPQMYDEFLYKSDIRKITVWRPYAGYKATLDLSQRAQSKRIFTNDLLRFDDVGVEAIYIFHLTNFMIYVNRKAAVYPSMRSRDDFNLKDYNFFLNCQEALIGLNSTQPATISLKSGSEFVEMHGDVRVSDITNKRLLFGQNIFLHQEVRALPTSWAKLFPQHVFFENRYSNISVVNGVSAQLSAFDTTFTLSSSSIRMRANACNYTCVSIPESENIIKIPWRPNELAQFKMSKKASTAILYEKLKTDASYLKISDRLNWNMFQFEPNHNNISMANFQNRIEYDVEQAAVRISDAENGVLRVDKSFIECLHSNDLSSLTIYEDRFVFKKNKNSFVLQKNNVTFFNSEKMLCSITILYHKLKNKDYKFEKKCTGKDGSWAEVSIAVGVMYASYGQINLMLNFKEDSLEIATLARKVVVQNATLLSLDCRWVTAQTTRDTFLSKIWKTGKKEATGAGSYNASIREQNDLVKISNNQSFFNYLTNSTHTQIDMTLGSILLNHNVK